MWQNFCLVCLLLRNSLSFDVLEAIKIEGMVLSNEFLVSVAASPASERLIDFVRLVEREVQDQALVGEYIPFF